MNTPTAAEMKAGLRVLQALAETIREIGGPVPLGPMYASCMPLIDLAGFNKAIELLKGAKLIEDCGNHCVRWVGPVIPTSTHSAPVT